VVDGAEGRNVRFARRVGRPRKVRVRPEPAVVDYASEIDLERQAFVDEETAKYAGEPDGVERVWATLRMLAQEAAALKFSQRRLELEDREGADKVASRVIETYSRMASLFLELKKVGGAEHIDPHHPMLQRLVMAFEERLEEAVRQTLCDADAERFLVNYRRRCQGWEERI
jgi:hypothetical protein